MKISARNIYAVIALVITSILGPVLVWKYTQGKIEKTKTELTIKQLEIDNLELKVSNKQLEMEQIQHTVELFGKLNNLLNEQRDLYDKYADLVQKGHTIGSYNLQRIYSQIAEKDQEIQIVKQAISKFSGKDVKNIKGELPPLPPSGVGFK